jgi:magnesium chelatase family protein
VIFSTNGAAPFRAPHHTASAVALIGGGSQARPGEVSLAHGSVLFLDELSEYPRKVLDVLREPLESGEVAIAAITTTRCTPDQILRYRTRISGPLLDRIDIFVHAPRLPPGGIQDDAVAESSREIRLRVVAARERQLARAGSANGQLGLKAMKRDCALEISCRELLLRAERKLGLSARAQHRIIKVARTIADLAGADAIQASHLSEALAYRDGVSLRQNDRP